MEESAKPEPAPETTYAPETSYAPATEVENNKMSQDDIEALLRSVGLDDSPAPEPDISVDASTRSQEEPSGGKMSQDDIEKLLAASTAPADPLESASDEPSGGKMSQDDIEKLLAATLGGGAEPEIVENNAPETPVDDTPAAEPTEPPQPTEPTQPAEPAPAEPSGGIMSQDVFEKLLAATLGGGTEPEIVENNAPETPVEDTPAAQPPQPPQPPQPTEPTEPTQPTEPAPAEPSGGKMSQEDIEALLNSMQDEANK